MKQKRTTMRILERVRRCKHCGRPRRAPALACAENPFCAKCLGERTRAASPIQGVMWRLRGHYVEFLRKDS
jgi:hypothetical protein